MVTVQGQRLAERQKGLAACACLMAQGDLERLEPAVKMALDNGVTINELKERTFALDDDDMAAIAMLDTGSSSIQDESAPEVTRPVYGFKIHE